MSDQDTVEKLRAQGVVDAPTVGEILGEQRGEAGGATPARFTPPVTAPRLEGQPEWPGDGVFFEMPEEDYHAIHAFSTSGAKRLAVSSMDYWADSPMNPEPEERAQKDYFDFGNAIHTLVLEGEEVYRDRYVIGLDRAAFEGLLETSEEIGSAIIAAGGVPVTRIETGDEVPSPTKAEPERMKAVTRAAKKEDLIEQLLGLRPEAKIWDRIKAEFEAQHEGAEFISAKIDRRVRIAARMILGQADIAENLRGGYAEVSVFWHCPVTGAPMKARFDYLKHTRIVDLKSFGNRNGLPIDRAIERAIGNMRYNVQQVVYVEAAEAAKGLIRERGADAIFTPDDVGYAEMHEWCEEWAAQPDEPDFMFIFQKTGIAPVTRGKIMPRENMGVFGVTQRRVEELKRAFVANCEVYGLEPWLDIQPVEAIPDENLPIWATEI